MSLLANFDPGDAVAGLILVVVFQTSVMILVAALLGRALLWRHAEARYALSLGAMVLISISPAIAVASRSGIALWVIAFPATGNGVASADHEVAGDRVPGRQEARSNPSRLAAELPDVSVSAEAEPLCARRDGDSRRERPARPLGAGRRTPGQAFAAKESVVRSACRGNRLGGC
jgi:hypothetical protein